MKKQGRSSPPWADLQSELLGLVLLRLPSLVDRVRLRAVCRSWCSKARLQPLPPPLPWLSLLDGASLSIPDGKLIRVPAPDGAFCCCSVDSSLFLVHSDGRCSLVNPFSKATLDLPKVTVKWFHGRPSSFQKMVVSSPLEQESSQGSLAVALILNKSGTIRMCQPQPPIATSLSIRGMREPWWHDQLKDIAIFNGKLYGLGVEEDNLSIFEMKYGHDGKPMISRVRCITRHPTERVILPKPLRASEHFITNYLVECCGRLLMVERKIECNHETGEYGPTAAFELFEADLSTKPGRWRCLSSLGGQRALFIGNGSRSVPAGGNTGIQEDCVYFICDYGDDLPPDHRVDYPLDPLQDSGAYNLRNGSITPLLSEGVAAPQHRGGQWRPTWLFPS